MWDIRFVDILEYSTAGVLCERQTSINIYEENKLIQIIYVLLKQIQILHGIKTM